LETGYGVGRDSGPVSTRATSKGALLEEARAVFSAIGSGATIEQARAACFTGELLRQSAHHSRHRIWEALHWRYFTWNPSARVLADLGRAARNEADPLEFTGLAYLHYARRDRLTFDLVTRKLWAAWGKGERAISRDDVLDFLSEYEAHEAAVRRWRESTRKKLAGNVLSALRDFGVLIGVQRKALQQPIIRPTVVLHLCRLLDEEGLRGRALIEARDWKLFLWGIAQTSAALSQLAQVGEIAFERAGNTVMLEVPKAGEHAGNRRLGVEDSRGDRSNPH